MRKAAAAVSAILLLTCQCPGISHSADVTAIEAWTRSKEAPLTPATTRFDTTVVGLPTSLVDGDVQWVLRHIPGRWDRPGWKPGDSTTTHAQEWVRIQAIPALGRGGAETLLQTAAGVLPPSAIELRERDPQSFDWIDVRLRVTVAPLPPSKRNGPARTRVVASAQFVGLPRSEAGALHEPIEIRSSGLIERDFFERLQARLPGH